MLFLYNFWIVLKHFSTDELYRPCCEDSKTDIMVLPKKDENKIHFFLHGLLKKSKQNSTQKSFHTLYFVRQRIFTTKKSPLGV